MLEYGSYVRPCPGESVSGDSVIALRLDDVLFLAIVDVLGHGPEAHELSLVIDSYLSRYARADVVGVMQRLHQYLVGTRGAAVGLCAINNASYHLDYVGIGNTSIRRFGSMENRLVSKDGVLGQNMRTPLLQTLQLEPGDVIVLYTDGISDRFSADDYPGMLSHPPQDAARNIVQRFGKNHDDATCIAVRRIP